MHMYTSNAFVLIKAGRPACGQMESVASPALAQKHDVKDRMGCEVSKGGDRDETHYGLRIVIPTSRTQDGISAWTSL